MTDAAFPLKVSANGRYLVDSKNRPFLYHADTCWRIANRLTRTDALHFLDDRRARGFNTLHIHAINKEKTGTANPDGHKPFAPEDDITRPNAPYWQHLDEILKLATERGFLLAVSAVWFGYNGSGWRRNFTQENAPVYGRFLAERYNHHQNIVWILGGDNNPDGPDDKREATRILARTLRQIAPHQLRTYHAQNEHPSAHWFADDDWLDINFAYSYDQVYRQVLREYDRTPVRPIILSETGYEGEGNTGFSWNAELVRKQAWWTLLAGGAGHAQGNGTVWYLGDGWQQFLDKPATRHMSHVKALFDAHDWWKLVPDREHTLVTRGWRSFGDAHNAGAARFEDGGFALVYVPAVRTFMVDMGRLRGPVRARWYDPTWGAYQPVTGSPFPADGKREFTTPAHLNAAGDDDWALVLEA